MKNDLGYADLGVHGCRDIPTPRIDSLAHEPIPAFNTPAARRFAASGP